MDQIFSYLFICTFIVYTVSVSGYMTLDGRMKHQLERIWKEAVIVWGIILSVAGRDWLNHINLGIAGAEWRFQLGNFWI